jgi:hypothetical protein
MNSTVEPRLLSSIDEVNLEFERLQMARNQGRLLEVGNWTAGRVSQSLANWYDADIAWTERFIAWSPETAAFVAEARVFFGTGVAPTT